MKKIVLVILLVVAVAAVGTIYAIPNMQELALINFKDKKFDESRAMYEEQLKQGNLSPDTAGNLVDLYLQNGRVNDAIGVMEQFVAKRPTDLSARVILGQLYQYAQRQDDYLKNLEDIKAMNPSEAVLAKLHEEYQKDAQFSKQLSNLEALVQQGGGGAMDAARYRALATMQAQNKQYDEAIVNLGKLRQLDPASFKFPEVELMVSLQADAQHPDEALKEANAWSINPAAKAQELARLGDILNYKGNPALAMTYYGGIQARINESPELMTGYIISMIGAGQGAQAYALMQKLYADGTLPDALQNEMLMQAIAAGDMPTVLAMYDKADVAQFNESQLITLTELAAIKQQPTLLAKLKARFGAPEMLEKFPLFATVLALTEKSPEAEPRLAKLKDLPLDHGQLLVVARACARAAKGPCIRDMIARIGDVSALSEQESADLAELYLLAHDYTGGKQFVETARAAHDTPALNVAWAKFAAATGDQVALQTWLDSNAAATPEDVKSLYFLANDNHQTATSLMIAERLYAREASDENRKFLATAYVANKQYAKALPLFKDQKNRSAKDEEDYFFVLVNLAKQDPKYKKELTDYAASRLSAKTPEKQRLAMIYTLIEAGRADVAMPFIKQYATTQGGQWVSVYTDYLDKQGQYGEARSFRMKLATDPKTTPLVKRQIAYTLLNQGFKEDATALFYELASRPDGTQKDAEQLLYLWGPRLSTEQSQWVADKALASRGPQYDFWVQRLVTQTGSEDMVAFVQANPESLKDGRIARRYVQALSALKQLDVAHSKQAQDILASNNEVLLREFARSARANSANRPARLAYEQIASQSPQDPEALKGAGLIAFAQADYKASDTYLTSYLNARPADAAPDAETYLAYFDKGEILRKKGKLEEAKSYYRQCTDAVAASKNRTTDMESKAIQSMIFSGNVENGVASFRELVNAHPDNAALRVDFAAALIDAKRYDEARKVLREQSGALNPSAGSTPLHIPAGQLQGYRFFSNGNELLVQIADPRLRQSLTNPNLAQQFEWLGYATEGEDRVLIVAQPGVELALAPTENGYDVFPNTASQVSSDEQARQMRLRYELLMARIDVETGKSGTAISRLNGLQSYYPEDTQLLGFTANAENYAGRWKHAMALLDEAQAAAPENQDIAKLRRDIWLAHAPNVKIDQEWIKIGDSNQHVITLSGRADLGQNTDVSAFIQNDFIDADNIRRADGRIGSFSGVRQRGEVVVRHELENGLTPHAGLYASNNTIGGGVGLGFLSPVGSSDIFLDYHRPTFDFVEGVFDDAYRDRIGISHIYKPSTHTTLSGALAYNQYGVRGDQNTLSSVTFAGQAIWQFMDGNPNLAAYYSLDMEYRLDENLYSAAPGDTYTKLPLDSREVHTLGLLTGYAFDETLYGNLLAGWAYDRLGSTGPVVEGRITKELFNDKLEAQLRAGYGTRTSNKDGDVAHVGGYLMWRF